MESTSFIQIGKVSTTLEWLMTPIGLLIDEVTFEGGPLQIEIDELERSTGQGTFNAIIRAKSIEVFLEKIRPADMYDFQVMVRPDGIHIEAKKQVLVAIATSAHARLELDAKGSLSIELVAASAMGAGLKNLVSTQIEKMNPIVEASMFPIPVVFESVVHREGDVIVSGTARL